MDIIQILRENFNKSSEIPRIRPKKIVSNNKEIKKEAHKLPAIHDEQHRITPAPISHGIKKFVKRLVHLQKAEKEKKPGTTEGLEQFLAKKFSESPHRKVSGEVKERGKAPALPKGLASSSALKKIISAQIEKEKLPDTPKTEEKKKELNQKIKKEERNLTPEGKKFLTKLNTTLKTAVKKEKVKAQKIRKEGFDSANLLKYIGLKKKLKDVKKKFTPEERKQFRDYTKERGAKRIAPEKRAKGNAAEAIKVYKDFQNSIKELSPQENKWREKYRKNSKSRASMEKKLQKKAPTAAPSPAPAPVSHPPKTPEAKPSKAPKVKPEKAPAAKPTKTAKPSPASSAWKKGKRDYYYGKKVWWKWDGKPGERNVLPKNYQRGPIADGKTIPTWKPGHKDDSDQQHLWLRRVLEGAGKEVAPHPQSHGQLARFLEKVAGKGHVESDKKEKKKKEKKEAKKASKKEKAPKSTPAKEATPKKERIASQKAPKVKAPKTESSEAKGESAPRTEPVWPQDQ